MQKTLQSLGAQVVTVGCNGSYVLKAANAACGVTKWKPFSQTSTASITPPATTAHYNLFSAAN
jgi:hypothetical protein